MTRAELSRRGFLKAAGSAAGAGWLAALWPSVLAAAEQAAAARDAKAAFEVLAADDAADLAAMAAQIIPSGDGLPGANEAGVVYFMDSALQSFMVQAVEGVSAGLAALNLKAAAIRPGARFAALPGPEQARLLKAEEDSSFFGLVYFMTIAGMFALPAYGGNKDHLGWKLLGFEHRHFWQPPFGTYDARAAAKGARK